MISSDNRTKWLAARTELATASDVAAMLGESPYQTRAELMMIKAGLADAFVGSESTDIALALESSVADLARARWGWSLQRVGVLMIDPVAPRLGATPDYAGEAPWGAYNCQIKITQSLPTDGVKAPKSGKPSTAAFAAGPPLHMQLQVQAEMAVTGLGHSALLVLHTSPLALRSYYVPRHEGVIARIRAEVDVFWKEVESLKEGRWK